MELTQAKAILNSVQHDQPIRRGAIRWPARCSAASRSSRSTKRDFLGARRVINGQDKREKIAAQAEAWLKVL